MQKRTAQWHRIHQKTPQIKLNATNRIADAYLISSSLRCQGDLLNLHFPGRLSVPGRHQQLVCYFLYGLVDGMGERVRYPDFKGKTADKPALCL